MNPFAKARIKANLRQEQAADALHIERSTVAKWETGKAKPRADKLPAIARLYQCSIGELLSANEDDEDVERAV